MPDMRAVPRTGPQGDVVRIDCSRNAIRRAAPGSCADSIGGIVAAPHIATNRHQIEGSQACSAPLALLSPTVATVSLFQ